MSGAKGSPLIPFNLAPACEQAEVRERSGHLNVPELILSTLQAHHTAGATADAGFCLPLWRLCCYLWIIVAICGALLLFMEAVLLFLEAFRCCL